MILITGGAFQGKKDFAESFGLDNIMYDFHLLVRNCENIDILMEKAEKSSVVVSDDIGCGIVPLDKEDRLWRERTGRCLCILAQKAEKVYRVSMGIPVRIK